MRRACLHVVLATLVLAVATPDASAHSFDVACASSHISNDDPIVFPGQSGAAHRHEYFGARTTDAGSTTASLERSATSCAHPRDTAAYWVPTLEVRGVLLRGTMRAYYQRAGKARAAAPPLGLRMLAGDPRAAAAQDRATTSWQCVGRGRVQQHATPPACAPGERLGAWVKFPDCWNGRTLDSGDHRSHVAYAGRIASAALGARRCPASHPVAIMRLATLVTWPVRPQRAEIVRLGNGALPATGMHGDFWNAWHMPTLRQLRWDCIEVAAPCGTVPRRR